MYGLINAALKEWVVSKYGDDTWSTIRDAANVSIEFNKMQAYPDDVVYRLVASTAEVTKLSADQILDGFGEHWVEYTAAQGYAAMFDIAGDSLRDFLLGLDAMHARVGRSFPKLVPPQFRFDHVDQKTLRMHYLSARKNLCPMVFGLLRGLSLRFKTPISVREDMCARRGADHCEFMVVFESKIT
jgi:hypothetical protein